jgi:hypothetical protein
MSWVLRLPSEIEARVRHFALAPHPCAKIMRPVVYRDGGWTVEPGCFRVPCERCGTLRRRHVVLNTWNHTWSRIITDNQHVCKLCLARERLHALELQRATSEYERSRHALLALAHSLLVMRS